MMVADLPTRTPMEHLEGYLELWAQWMRSKDDLPEGCPTEASGGLQSYTGFDLDEMLDHLDNENAQKTHMAIWRLPDIERGVIYFTYGITIVELQVWRPDQVLARAKQRLLVEIRALGVWLGE